MNIDFDDEILADFLIEAGEIIDQLGGLLVALEKAPRDADLLNEIFRGFHTIKGGAGFLHLITLVEVCHRAEDVFNVLRQGTQPVTGGLMDAVLLALDDIKAQFAALQSGSPPAPADAALLATLERYARQEEADVPAAPAIAPAGGDPAPPDCTEAEFAALLDATCAAPIPPTVRNDAHGAGEISTHEISTHEISVDEISVDEISAAEFEALLDDLHGRGRGPGGTGTSGGAAAGAGIATTETDTTEPAATSIAAADGVGPDVPAGGAARVRADTTVRVDTQRLDQIMNLVGELVLVRNRLTNLKAAIDDEDVAKVVAHLEHVTTDLQASVMKTRMQPIRKVFSRFPRVVRDLARQLGKNVEIELRGEDTDLDKNMVEALADPLVHLVRNAVDHGIELPQDRIRAGKPPTGKILLGAEQQGDHILLTITDDGAGMDVQVLRRKAVEKGLIDAQIAAQMDEQQVFNLIFAPGFSTRSEISDVSGRGVGMDVVKTHIGRLNGSIEIDSSRGAGTSMRIRLPLTLAILPTLMIGVGAGRFALPLGSVNEILQLDGTATRVVDGSLCALVRGRALPLLFLRDWTTGRRVLRQPAPGEQVVVVQVGNRQLGMVVESVIGREEVVIKPLGLLLHGLPGLAGATITGDGGIALILDVAGLTGALLGSDEAIDATDSCVQAVA